MTSDFKQFIHNTLPNGGVMFNDTGKRLDGSIGKYITLIIKNNDHIINLIGMDPIIEVVPFLVNLHITDEIICYLFLLIRFNQNDGLLYEASINLADNLALNMLETTIQQEKQQIFIIGETQDSTIMVDLFMPYLQVASILKIVKEKFQLNWSDREYKKYIPVIYDRFNSPLATWEAFQKYGMIVNLRVHYEY